MTAKRPDNRIKANVSLLVLLIIAPASSGCYACCSKNSESSALSDKPSACHVNQPLANREHSCCSEQEEIPEEGNSLEPGNCNSSSDHTCCMAAGDSIKNRISNNIVTNVEMPDEVFPAFRFVMQEQAYSTRPKSFIRDRGSTYLICRVFLI